MQKDIYADGYEEAQWFKSLDSRLSDSSVQMYSEDNPSCVKSLLKYDNPDIILVVDGIPRLVVEKTRQVPTGSNIGQRYARLVRAVELGVPTIYMFPFAKLKGGNNPSPCWANPWYFKAIQRINSIHNDCDLVPVRWPNDDDYRLKNGSEASQSISDIVGEFITKNYQTLEFCLSNPEFEWKTFDEMSSMFKKSIENNSYWPEGPPSLSEVDTEEFLENIQTEVESNEFVNRGRTVIYKCGQKDVRTDPYTGMQFVYDYSLCRSGAHSSQKSKNFVIHLPKHTKSDWLDNYPQDTDTKGGLWYETANIIKFKDDILEL